ncbi:hypothetical protein BCR44DRAFT_40027 [Catenaria anguillulae PL171]|uniref:CCHC-type domain-containing protein n=1 Tax=Catenaria anguillulae PL171 TaxID=765915 RepID=A0A1Y2HYC7_9FUNG|nr:hypothetical protein BCR44DRAFT_40027 [Catenaria anguillulae PL171]
MERVEEGLKFADKSIVMTTRSRTDSATTPNVNSAGRHHHDGQRPRGRGARAQQQQQQHRADQPQRAGVNGAWEQMTCRDCGDWGHRQRNCPDRPLDANNGGRNGGRNGQGRGGDRAVQPGNVRN